MQMKYKLIDGVAFVSVCGVQLLVPTRKASEVCRDIATLSLFDRLMLKLIREGKTVDELYKTFSELTFRPVDAVKPHIDKFIDIFVSKGFLVPDEDS